MSHFQLAVAPVDRVDDAGRREVAEGIDRLVVAGLDGYWRVIVRAGGEVALLDATSEPVMTVLQVGQGDTVDLLYGGRVECFTIPTLTAA